MIGAHTITVGGVDISCLVDEAAITHGRSDPAGQPDAASITIDLNLTGGQLLPPECEIGAAIEAVTTLDGVTYPRFTGRLTDITLGWDDRGPDTPDAGMGQLIGTATLADLGRRVVGDAPFPAELDGARVARVLALAGVVLNPATSDPGTVTVIPRDVDATDALSVAHQTAESAAGVLWHTRAGDIRYADSNHRRNQDSTLTIDTCHILITPTWSRTIEGLVNAASIGYGVPPEGGGDQPRWTGTNPGSVNRYGTFAYSVATQLAAEADAAAMGGLILARNARPTWIMAALPVAMHKLNLTDTAVLLGLDVHDLITLTGLPTITTAAPTTALMWVEGWTERLTFGGHELEITVSGFCRSVPPPTWNQIPPETLWDSVSPPSLTWDGVACLGDLPDLGRWDDVSASTRWDQVAGSVTWDTYSQIT